MPDIDFQRIELNLIPKQGEQPVVFYASQYETTRPFKADLMWGETEFTPGEDCWAEIDIRKNDDNLVVITEDVAIDGNEVSVVLPVQALTCIGKNLGQVKIYSGEDQLIAALNFILEVQPDPLAGGVTSETDIDNLTQQIEDIAEEVIGEDYYDKTEVDALLADKADKSELPDMNNYYTKSQIDNTLVNNYATYNYLGIHYYNKASTENLIDAAVTLKGEAEGDIATFNTELSVLPDALNFYFDVPGGITELNVTNCGKNFVALNDSPYQTAVNTGVTVNSESTDMLSITSSVVAYACRQLYYKLPAGTYTVSLGETTKTGTDTPVISIYDYPDGTLIVNALSANNSVVFTLSDDTVLDIRLFATGNTAEVNTVTFSDFQIELGSTATAYETYTSDTTTIDLEGTYTEGYVDAINGVLHDTSVTPPAEHDITRTWIYQKEGINNFFSDGNDKTYVKYKDSIQHYIDTRV